MTSRDFPTNPKLSGPFEGCTKLAWGFRIRIGPLTRAGFIGETKFLSDKWGDSAYRRGLEDALIRLRETANPSVHEPYEECSIEKLPLSRNLEKDQTQRQPLRANL
jgi:hypothetical protein